MCEKITYFADSAIQNQLVHSMHLYISMNVATSTNIQYVWMV